MFPELSQRAVNVIAQVVPFEMIRDGDGSPEARCVQWIEAVSDERILQLNQVGRSVLGAIRGAIPSNRSRSLICEHCGGSGRRPANAESLA
jgi:hypothetical protein